MSYWNQIVQKKSRYWVVNHIIYSDLTLTMYYNQIT